MLNGYTVEYPGLDDEIPWEERHWKDHDCIMNILENQIKEKNLLILRINTFTRIKELLNNSCISSKLIQSRQIFNSNLKKFPKTN